MKRPESHSSVMRHTGSKKIFSYSPRLEHKSRRTYAKGLSGAFHFGRRVRLSGHSGSRASSWRRGSATTSQRAADGTNYRTSIGAEPWAQRNRTIPSRKTFAESAVQITNRTTSAPFPWPCGTRISLTIASACIEFTCAAGGDGRCDGNPSLRHHLDHCCCFSFSSRFFRLSASRCSFSFSWVCCLRRVADSRCSRCFS
jgi:hypothetical protein